VGCAAPSDLRCQQGAGVPFPIGGLVIGRHIGRVQFSLTADALKPDSTLLKVRGAKASPRGVTFRGRSNKLNEPALLDR
jgi:hypothetical protein